MYNNTDSTVHLIIDSDMGIDDALATLIALTCDRCSVDAICVVHGNTTVSRTWSF